MLKRYSELINNENLKKSDFFSYILEKCIQEYRLGLYAASNESFKLLIDNIRFCSETYDKVIEMSFKTNNVEELLDVSIKNFTLVNELDDSKLLIKIFKFYVSSIVNNEDLDFRIFLDQAKNNTENSILCTLISEKISEKNIRNDFNKTSLKIWKDNLYAAKKLIDNNCDVHIKYMIRLLKLNSDKINLPVVSEKKEDVNFNLEFESIGGGEEIGASCYYMKLKNLKVLIDCGSKVSNSILMSPNFDLLKTEEGKYREIDALIITHSHFDHCGSLLKLIEIYPKLKIFLTSETRELIRLNLFSSLSITEQSALDSVLSRAITLKDRECITLKNSGVTFEFYKAGHILGAVAILFKSDDCNVFFTGDYSIDDQFTLRGMDVPNGEHIDVLITENTYGNKKDKNFSRLCEVERLKEIIKGYIRKGKKILVPAFSIGRGQEVLSILKDSFKGEDIRFYVDGSIPSVNEVYEKNLNISFDNKNIFYPQKYKYITKDELIEEEILNNNSCVISSSGMLLEGSTAVTYLKHFISNSNCACILTGYQANDSIGSKILNQMEIESNNKYINIEDNTYKINCSIDTINLSAHASYDDIIALTLLLNPSETILVHGNVNEENSNILCDELNSKYGKSAQIALDGRVIRL